MGRSKALSLAANSREGYVPTGSVACPLEASESVVGGYFPKPLSKGHGRAFCYLPLPVATGLPVHINAMFALHSDRRQLSYATEDDKNNVRVEWNVAQLADTLTLAYVQLLQDLCLVHPRTAPGVDVAPLGTKETDLSILWPTMNDTETYFRPLVRMFYALAVKSTDVPMTCGADGNLRAFAQTIFLESTLAASQLVGTVAMEALSMNYVTTGGRRSIGIMSDAIRSALIAVGEWDSVEASIFTMERFYSEIFFPNLSNLSALARDSLVLFALQQNSALVQISLREHACIPASPDGSKLRRPCDLVHPLLGAANLFDPVDGRFPHSGCFNSKEVLDALQRLGMCVNELSWADILDRCRAMQAFWRVDPKLAKSRLTMLMIFMDKMLLSSSVSCFNIVFLSNVKLFNNQYIRN